MIPGFAEAVTRLRAAGVDSPRLDVRILWEHAEGLAAAGGWEAGQTVEALFEGFLARRVACEPVAYITGHREFWGLDFAVGPGVLIPRPDTETMIEAVLKAVPDKNTPLRLLDLGTGTGCILASLLHEYPGASGVGLEASPVAGRYAAQNFAAQGLDGRAELKSGNWQDAGSGFFDIVLSNPPYIPSADIPGLMADVAEYEPVSALDGGEDGLAAYRAIAGRLLRWLKPGGLGFFEIGQGQETDVAGLFEAAGLRFLQAHADLSGILRVIAIERP